MAAIMGNHLTRASLTQLIKQRLGQTWRLYLMLFIPMWIMFVLNHTLLFGIWNDFGIKPREFGVANIIGILGSWTMHANLAHITANSLVMAQVLLFFGVFERNATRTIAGLIIGSGLLTWLLGSSHSQHIGASGLAFAMLGFMIAGALFAKRWGYLIGCIILGTGFWLAVGQGLVPQDKISFAGHFGGLCAGLLFGAQPKKRLTRL